MTIWVDHKTIGAAAAAFAISFASVGHAANAIPHSEAEFALETRAMVEVTAALFDAVESTPAPSGPNVLTLDVTPASLSGDDAIASAFPSDRGPVQHLTGYRINFYPTGRLLGAVDFMGTFDKNRNLVCGYVTWDLTDPDAPQMMQLVANYVDVGTLTDQPVDDAHAALLEANCAYGDIDPNFTVFEPGS